MDQQKEKILKAYQESVQNFRQALREAGVPETLILYYTINLPELSKLLPEDVIKFYQEVKTAVVLHFSDLGFSHRETARRIGGHSTLIVGEILKKYRPKLVNPEEVSK